MVSGLYDQIHEGDLKAAKMFMNQRILKVDQYIQSDIYQMNQFTQIKNPILKVSLLLK